MVEDRECEWSSGTGQEWEFAWDESEYRAVEAVLLALLTDDASNEWNKSIISVGCKTGLDILKGSKDHVCEGAGEVDRGVEVGTWEDVFAWLDGCLTGCRQDAVGTERMEFFLGLDSGKSIQDNALEFRAWDLKAGYVVGNVLNEAGEEGNLKEFIEGDGLEASDVASGKFIWRWGVWQSAMCLLLLLVVSICFQTGGH